MNEYIYDKSINNLRYQKKEKSRKMKIQDAMGWSDYHLHLFEVRDPSTGMKIEIGIPGKEYGEEGKHSQERNKK